MIKDYLKKSVLFNTVNLNRKEILCKNVSQLNVKKEYGEFFYYMYPYIYNLLFEKSIRKFYKKKINSKIIFSKEIYKLIFHKILFHLNKQLSKIKSITKILILLFYNKKIKLKKKNIILKPSFFSHNQMSFVPIHKKIKSSSYVLIKSLNKKEILFYNKLYGKENIVNYYDHISFSDSVRAFIFLYKNSKKIISFIRLFKNPPTSYLEYLYTLFCNYNTFLTYKKILGSINPKKTLIMTSINNEMYIFAFKSMNYRSNVYGYAVQGVSLTNQSLTSQFLYNLVDTLFCYGKSDFFHFRNLSNKKFSMPKKILISGSIRDYYHNKFHKKKKLNKQLKILYLRSSPIWFGDIDSYYLKIFSEIISCNFKSKFKYKIKERGNLFSNQSKELTISKIISKSQVITNEKYLTEKLINESDIIVGTVSTSLLYQSLFFNKLFIQLGSNQFPWGKYFQKMGLSCLNNKKQIINFMSNIENNNKFYNDKIKQQKKLADYLITKKNSVKFISKELLK